LNFAGPEFETPRLIATALALLLPVAVVTIHLWWRRERVPFASMILRYAGLVFGELIGVLLTFLVNVK